MYKNKSLKALIVLNVYNIIDLYTFVYLFYSQEICENILKNVNLGWKRNLLLK